MRIRLIFLLLLFTIYLHAQTYSCAGGDQVELMNLSTSPSGPGCLVSLELEITAVNYGNWSWSGGGSSGGFWLPTTTDPQPQNIGPFYINKNCTNLAGETVSLNHVNTNTFCTPIPLSSLAIDLHSFEIVVDGENHKAVWRAEVEDATEYFILEISENSRDWRRWLNLAGEPGINEYEAFLPYVKSGILYARLKMVSRNGAYRYSKIQVLTTTRNNFHVYPSLVSRGEMLNIHTEDKSDLLQLINVHGRVIYQGEVTNGTLQIPTAITPGMYYVKINTQQSVTQKIFIQ